MDIYERRRNRQFYASEGDRKGLERWRERERE
jgi:hypothetical protein